jgi:molecular chaperone GrpE
MPEKTEPREQAPTSEAARNGNDRVAADDTADESFRVDDRRHWAADSAGVETEVAEAEEEVAPARPTVLDEYRQRTEEAEGRLQEYIDAFKRFKAEQEQVRVRLQRDVDRRVALKFGELVGDLLESMDDLDRALSHVADVPEAGPLTDGLLIVRKRFLTALERHGVEQIIPDEEPFDPNHAEAVRVDPVEEPEKNGQVTETLRPGYRLEGHVIRPARVAVGRYAEAES